MNRKFRILSLILAIGMLVSLMVGCSTEKKGNETATTAATVAPTAAATPQTTKDAAAVEAEKKYKVTYATYVEGPVNKDNYVEKYMENKFNIDLDVLTFERSSWESQMNVKLASGEIPDFWLPTDYSGKSHYEQKIIAPFTLDFIKKNMPEWFDTTLKFNETYDCQLWAAGRFDGKNNYVLPAMQFFWIDPWAMTIRQDWMDNVGITKVPETLDEFEVLLDKFTNADPDKNNKKDTYGITIEGKDDLVGSVQFVFTAFGTSNYGSKINVDGKWVDGYLHPGYQLALKKLNSWYEKGYIDPEFITVDWTKKMNDYASNKIGVHEVTWYRVLGFPDDYVTAVKNAPGAKVTFVRPPLGPDGSGGYPVNEPCTSIYVFGQHLTKDIGKWERILKMINGIATDKEIYTALNGQEGVHFDITDMGLKYKPEYDAKEKRADVGDEAFGLFRTMGSPDFQKIMYLPNADMEDVTRKCAGNVKYVKTNGIGVQRTEELSKELNQINQKKEAIHQKWLVAFITGDKSVDKDWNAYIKEIEDTGDAKYQYLHDEDMTKFTGILNQIDAEIKALK